MQVGVELEINSRIQESTGTIAYQIDLPKADLVFRGTVAYKYLVSILKQFKLFDRSVFFYRRKRRHKLDSWCCFGKKIATIAIFICVKRHDES